MDSYGGIVLITRGPLIPATGGGAVRTLACARRLSSMFTRVVIAGTDESSYLLMQNGREEKKSYPLLIKKISQLLRKTCNPERHTSDLGIPHEEAPFYFAIFDRGYDIRIAYLALRYRIRTFQAEFIGFCMPCLRLRWLFRGKVISATHNVEFERISRIYAEIPENKKEQLAKLETTINKQCDSVIAVSERDRNTFLSHGINAEKICIIPNGVELKNYASVVPYPIRELYGLNREALILFFHGAVNYPPNWRAVTFIAESILPALKKKGIESALIVSGKKPQKAPKWPEVYFTGYVEELASFIASADIALCPLDSGGGSRLKLLEYFAAGVPVIASSIGAEGIPVQDNEHLRIAESLDDYVTCISKLAASESERQRLADNAKCFVRDFDWDKLWIPSYQDTLLPMLRSSAIHRTH